MTEPESLVGWCGAESLLVQVTVVPRLIVTCAGEKAKFCMVIAVLLLTTGVAVDADDGAGTLDVLAGVGVGIGLMD